ncbi:DUF1649-domain-containing protein [Panus rudis PR-1116 ss-1]|nr:DUF1649-domain-containing protein [Panus rudis PR-1116 ss-1]
MSEPYAKIEINLVLDRHTTKEVLRAVLHAVLFHRLFGTVKPQTFEVLDVTLPGVDDPEIKALVQEKVDAFWKAVELGSSKRGQITLVMSERRQRKTWFPVLGGEEEVPWEQWNINAEVRQPTTERERLKFNQDLASTLTKSLKTILTHTSSAPGRSGVPPITNAGGISPFPYKITVKVGGVEVG